MHRAGYPPYYATWAEMPLETGIVYEFLISYADVRGTDEEATAEQFEEHRNRMMARLMPAGYCP